MLRAQEQESRLSRCDTPGWEGGKMKWKEFISDDRRCSIPDPCPLERSFSRHRHNSPEEQCWVLGAEVRGRVRLGERSDPVPVSISRSFTTNLGRSRAGTHLGTSDPGEGGETCKSLKRATSITSLLGANHYPDRNPLRTPAWHAGAGRGSLRRARSRRHSVCWQQFAIRFFRRYALS